jgi:hypothetical protein
MRIKRNKIVKEFEFTNMFPLKHKNSVVIMKSDNPNYTHEIYDYRGIFLSYLGNINDSKNTDN